MWEAGSDGRSTKAQVSRGPEAPSHISHRSVLPSSGMNGSLQNPLLGGAEGAAFRVGPSGSVNPPTPAPLQQRGIFIVGVAAQRHQWLLSNSLSSCDRQARITLVSCRPAHGKGLHVGFLQTSNPVSEFPLIHHFPSRLIRGAKVRAIAGVHRPVVNNAKAGQLPGLEDQPQGPGVAFKFPDVSERDVHKEGLGSACDPPLRSKKQ
jgi:hypothetical protein